jgi:hypothetical protein
MPVNTKLADDVWNRYQWLRDNGHIDFVNKADKCEDFFAGEQWEPKDLSLLKAYRRPALTINKILSTISNVLGEQIYNRTDISFRPRNEGATSEIADALTKVFMQISDNNQLPWIRSDVFADGVITSRGFFDVRLDFSDSLRGEVRIEPLNPKNVLVDADADEYDPDKWGDVIVTKWMTIDEIEMLYSKADADMLRNRTGSYWPYSYDAVDMDRDRFGKPRAVSYTDEWGRDGDNARSVRIIERQWRKLDRVAHFVDIATGDMRIVPPDWGKEQVDEYLEANPGLTITKKMIRRIRWTVVADNIVLHDDWSPYKHFTVVPFFPYFRRGHTMGLVENLIGPQELLNKTSSQELHVVNTSANSGWKVKRNALQNMSVAELEQRGAQSGLVLELDELNSAEKITPNSTPTGLDRISYKAEEHIKSISGVSDYMQGFAREDVSAKSVLANQRSGQANLAKVMDNMMRTDNMLARNILDIVQEYYTEERVVLITGDRLSQQTEQMVVNQVGPEGQIFNDLTLGEYGVVVSSQPDREVFEDSQFDQAVALRTQLGVNIPDRFLIESSRLRNKTEIVQSLQVDPESPEGQAQARRMEAELSLMEAEAVEKRTDAELKQMRAQTEAMNIQKGAQEPPNTELLKLQGEFQLKNAQMQQEYELKREEMDRDYQLKREQMEMEIQLKREMMQQESRIKREAAAVASNQQVEAQTT